MTETDLQRIAANLVPLEPGILGSPSAAKVSFPDHGHAECFELEDRSFWFQHRNRCIVELVARFPPDGPIFDVGGGNGYVALGLRQAGRDAVLVEPGLEGARFAQRRGLAPVVCATVEEAGFAQGTLAAIGVFDVVEHVEEDAAFVQRLANLLRPGGRLYVTVPAYGWLWSQEDEIAGHFRRYRVATLTRLLAGAGFAIDFASYFFAPLPLPIFLTRSLPGRLGRKPQTTNEKYASEHVPDSRGKRVLDVALRGELALLRSGRALPFGSSIIAAAHLL